jgi:hypothetical protein
MRMAIEASVGVTVTIERDQARDPVFRALMGVQVLAAGFFGLFPFLAPGEFARVFGLSGDEPYLFRLAGAATIGYAVAALLGLRSSWRAIRVPLIATLTFNLAAVTACLISIDESGIQPLATLVALAAGTFALLSAYWLNRDEGPRGEPRDRLEPGFRLTIAAGVLASGLVATTQLLLPQTFVELFGLSGSDLVIVRLAGAATLGYSTGGLFSLLADDWRAARIQTVAAVAANVAAALASAIYLAQGGPSILGWLFLLASGFLVLALTGWAARAQR